MVKTMVKKEKSLKLTLILAIIVILVIAFFSKNIIIKKNFIKKNFDKIVFATENMYVTNDEKVKVYIDNKIKGISCIYEGKLSPYATQAYDFSGGVVVLEVYDVEDGLEYSLNYIKNSTCKLLQKEKATKFPYVYVADDFLLINSQYDNSTYLYSYTPKDDKPNIIDKRNFTKESEGYTGEAIYFAGGSGNTVYYQVVSADNESFDRGKLSHLIKYDLSTKKVIEVIPLKDKVLHVSGNKDAYIISEYSYREPLIGSGKIFVGNKQVSMINEVSSGKDIIFSKATEDNIIFANTENLWKYDFKKDKLSSKSIKDKKFYLLQDGIVIGENNTFDKLSYSKISWNEE